MKEADELEVKREREGGREREEEREVTRHLMDEEMASRKSENKDFSCREDGRRQRTVSGLIDLSIFHCTSRRGEEKRGKEKGEEESVSAV